MEIANVQINTYKIPLPEPVEAYAAGVMKAFDLVICKITNNDGIEGLGYITVHENQGLAISQIIKNSFKPLLIKQDPRLIEFLWKNMWKATHYAGRGAPVSFAIAAVDVALWDLKGKCLKEPLWRLLGGHDKKVLAYAGNIDLNFEIDKLLDGATKSLEDGFKSIKMRLGRKLLSDDLKRLDAMREHLPDDVMLMADANEAWRVDQAVAAFKEIERFNLVWLEEPIKPDDFNGYSYLRSLGKIPIAAGENLHNLTEFNHLINVNGVDFLEPDLTTCGGITPFMKVAKLAEINNLPICSHGVHEIHVHLLAACPNASYLEFHAWKINEFTDNSLSINNGYTEPSNRPGHGVNFDYNKLKKYSIS
jgi:L-alanine-DL-glutamate epimerase-like enolase superfamily enzyme